MTAWTSPERMTMSTPCRISRPGMPARRPAMTSSLMRSLRTRRRAGRARSCQIEHDDAVAHGNVIDRHRPGGRQGLGFAGAQVEGAAVLPALDGALVRVDRPLRQGDVLVTALVPDGVHLVPDPDHGDAAALDIEAPGLAVAELVEPTELNHGRS